MTHTETQTPTQTQTQTHRQWQHECKVESARTRVKPRRVESDGEQEMENTARQWKEEEAGQGRRKRGMKEKGADTREEGPNSQGEEKAIQVDEGWEGVGPASDPTERGVNGGADTDVDRDRRPDRN